MTDSTPLHLQVINCPNCKFDIKVDTTIFQRNKNLEAVADAVRVMTMTWVIATVGQQGKDWQAVLAAMKTLDGAV